MLSFYLHRVAVITRYSQRFLHRSDRALTLTNQLESLCLSILDLVNGIERLLLEGVG